MSRRIITKKPFTFRIDSELEVTLNKIVNLPFEMHVESSIGIFLGVQDLNDHAKAECYKASVPIGENKKEYTLDLDEDLGNYFSYYCEKHVLAFDEFLEKAVAMYLGWILNRREMLDAIAKPLIQVTLCNMQEEGFLRETEDTAE